MASSCQAVQEQGGGGTDPGTVLQKSLGLSLFRNEVTERWMWAGCSGSCGHRNSHLVRSDSHLLKYVSLYTVSHCFNNDRVAFAGHLWFVLMVYPLFYMNPHVNQHHIGLLLYINDRYWPIWLIDNQYQRWKTWSGRLCLIQQYISLHLVWKVLFLKLWFTVKLFMSVEKCLSSNNIIFILLLL